MTMGTASTMTAIAETLGLTLPGAVVDPRRALGAQPHGQRDAAGGSWRWCGKTCGRADILTPEAFDNAITVDMAIGGSTNAIIHLIAMAGRAGIKLPLERFDEISQRTPVDRQPAARRRVPDGGLLRRRRAAGAARAASGTCCTLDCPTVNGQTLGENIAGAKVCNDKVILLARASRCRRPAATFVLRGNLAPDGCVIKPTAAEPRLLKHTGPAVVFKNYADLKARIDDDDLRVTPDSRARPAERRPDRRARACRSGACCRSRRSC